MLGKSAFQDDAPWKVNLRHFPSGGLRLAPEFTDHQHPWEGGDTCGVGTVGAWGSHSGSSPDPGHSGRRRATHSLAQEMVEAEGGLAGEASFSHPCALSGNERRL